MSLTHPSHVILVPGADGRVFSEDSVRVHASGIVTHPITSKCSVPRTSPASRSSARRIPP
jgi:hypothetical protein